MQIVLDFVEGKISVNEFMAAWDANPAIGEWVDQLVDLRSALKAEWSVLPFSEYRMAIHKHFGGSVRAFWRNSEQSSREHPHPSDKWFGIGGPFHAIAAVVVVAYPGIKPTSFYDDETDFYLATIGDYLGGEEVDQLINEVLSKYPPAMGKTKRKKAAKAALREAFHIQPGKYPRWAQEADWPMGKNSPMEYLGQHRDGELVALRFRDVDTGEVRVVEQFY